MGAGRAYHFAMSSQSLENLDQLPDLVVIPYLNVPKPIFFVVAAPVSGVMVFVIFTAVSTLFKILAAAVIGYSIYAYIKGYVRRIELTLRGVRFLSVGRTIRHNWSQIKKVGNFHPEDAPSGTDFIYLTARESPPKFKDENTEDTFVVQDRLGLLDLIERYRRSAQ
jgi:hypothetical protein